MWLIQLGAIGLLAAGPRSGEPANLLEQANASNQVHRPLDAVERYCEYLARYPDRAYVLDGRVYSGRVAWEPAQEAFTQALRLDPRDREAWYFSGRAWYEQNRFEKAIEAFQKARSLGSEQSPVYENLGLAYEAPGKFAEAGQACRRAVELGGVESRHRQRARPMPAALRPRYLHFTKLKSSAPPNFREGQSGGFSRSGFGFLAVVLAFLAAAWLYPTTLVSGKVLCEV